MESMSPHAFQRIAHLKQALRECLPLESTQGCRGEAVSFSPLISGLKHVKEKGGLMTCLRLFSVPWNVAACQSTKGYSYEK